MGNGKSLFQLVIQQVRESDASESNALLRQFFCCCAIGRSDRKWSVTISDGRDVHVLLRRLEALLDPIGGVFLSCQGGKYIWQCSSHRDRCARIGGGAEDVVPQG